MYRQMVESNDRATKRGIERQVLDSESRYYGGTIDPFSGVAWVNHTTGTPTDMCFWGQPFLIQTQRIIVTRLC